MSALLPGAVPVLAGLLGFAVEPSPGPTSVEVPPESQTTPGFLGFIVTFAVVIAVILLAFSMVRQLRRVDHRARREAEAQAGAGAGAAGAGSGAPGDAGTAPDAAAAQRREPGGPGADPQARPGGPGADPQARPDGLGRPDAGPGGPDAGTGA